VRKLVLIVAGFAIFTLAARAQQVDAAIGLSTLMAPSAASATGNYSTQSIGGGSFLTLSGDFMLRHHMGVGAEIAWRATQNSYADIVPFRPIFYNFDGVYAPPLMKKVALDLKAGIGVESSRFYQDSTVSCNGFTGTCTNYTSSNHFMGHFGGGIKFYPMNHVFIRPGVDLYLIHNNLEFSGAHATRVGLSLGYTFGGE
jgi:hypothetical protein